MKNKALDKVIVPETLLMFLVEWLEWATSENPEEDKFSKMAGLCYNAYVWSRRQKGKPDIKRELLMALLDSNLDIAYPFGVDAFYRRVYGHTQHLDPQTGLGQSHHKEYTQPASGSWFMKGTQIVKEIKESVFAMLILLVVLILGYKVGYSYGMDDGISLAKGQKWECVWAESTGFAVCNKTEEGGDLP